MRIRRPAVSGQFYSSDPEELRKEIRDSFLSPQGPGRLPPGEFEGQVFATVNPHAGYMYSGGFASNSFYAISSRRSVDVVVILGPNHYGLGSGVAAPQSEVWETPLGKVDVDVQLARKLLLSTKLVDMDDAPHWREHSVEVQIPFLQFSLEPGFKVLPISMAMQDMETAVEVGESLGRLLSGRDCLLIASSDFTHYEPASDAKKKDEAALKGILNLDVPELYRAIEKLGVTMCGYGPVAAVMTAARHLGADKAKLLKYGSSGDVTGDFSSVVGYASVVLYR